MNNLRPEILKQLKNNYLPGTRVVLVKMDDPYTKISPGTKGTVTGIDDLGTIHVNWDSGSTLGVAYGEDSCRKIEEEDK